MLRCSFLAVADALHMLPLSCDSRMAAVLMQEMVVRRGLAIMSVGGSVVAVLFGVAAVAMLAVLILCCLRHLMLQLNSRMPAGMCAQIVMVTTLSIMLRCSFLAVADALHMLPLSCDSRVAAVLVQEMVVRLGIAIMTIGGCQLMPIFVSDVSRG